MFRKIDDFLDVWNREVGVTESVYRAVNPEMTRHRYADGNRTLGELMAHNVSSVHRICRLMHLDPGISEPDPESETDPKRLLERYREVALAVASRIRGDFEDEDLLERTEVYGESWPRGRTLMALVLHQAHHRAQMVQLLRALGATVPAVYGPSADQDGVGAA